MREAGIDPATIDYAILTHGHVDHAGTAAAFQSRHGIEIVGGAGDEPMIAAGGRAELCPTSMTARLVQAMVGDSAYPVFELDHPIAMDGPPTDLSTFGITGTLLPPRRPHARIRRRSDRTTRLCRRPHPRGHRGQPNADDGTSSCAISRRIAGGSERSWIGKASSNGIPAISGLSRPKRSQTTCWGRADSDGGLWLARLRFAEDRSTPRSTRHGDGSGHG